MKESVDTVTEYSQTVQGRFWSRINKSGSVPSHVPQLGQCWEWTGTKAKYGILKLFGSNIYTHRLSWELHFSPIPKGMMVCHKCDNMLCVRPDHLFLGTHMDNVRDCMSKGRTLIGERNANTKLTPAQVLEIRALYSAGHKQIPLAVRFNVTQEMVSSIVLRKSWKHI